MKKNVFAAAVGALCALLFLCEPHSFGQDLSGTSLAVSGTATIGTLVSGTATFNELNVIGAPDFQSNTLYFGTSGTTSALSLTYNDGTSGTNSSVTLQSTRPSTAWKWQRLTASGTATTAMQLDASNRLILTGTAANAPQLVLDPNMTSGSNSVLTQAAANGLYVSSTNFTVVTRSDTSGNVGSAIALTGGQATGPYSFAGFRSTATQFGANASGYQSNATGWGSTASAVWSTASGPSSTAIGFCSIASANQTVAIGCNSQALGDASSAIGGFAKALGYASNALGLHSQAVGTSSCAVGFASQAVGSCSTTFGAWSTANGDDSVSAGGYTTAAGFGQFVVGQYNIPQGDPYHWVATDDLFVVGNGTAPSNVYGWHYYDGNGNLLPRVDSNAFVVKKNGDTTVYGKLTLSGTSGGVNSITNGGLVVTGTAVPVTLTSGSAATKIVASGSNQLALVPEQGDLSMGDFVNGTQPLLADSSQMTQQGMQRLAPTQTMQGASSNTSNDESANSDENQTEILRAHLNADAMERMDAMGVPLPLASHMLGVPSISGSDSAITTGTDVIQ